jgi:CheY-like chemotaxis protein
LIPAGALGAVAVIKKPFTDAQITQALDALVRTLEGRADGI